MYQHDIDSELAIAGAQQLLTSASMARLAARARKSMDAEAAAQFEQNCRGMYDQMARIAITPHRVRYFDFGAGRLPRFLQELAEQSQA